MSAPVADVVPIFATPFGVVTLPVAQALNPALDALFAERATPERRDPGGGVGKLTFRSRDDLLEWPDEPVRQVLREVLAGVSSMVSSINGFSAEEFAALRMQAR